jgi:hypothetical protein
LRIGERQARLFQRLVALIWAVPFVANLPKLINASFTSAI